MFNKQTESIILNLSTKWHVWKWITIHQILFLTRLDGSQLTSNIDYCDLGHCSRTTWCITCDISYLWSFMLQTVAVFCHIYEYNCYKKPWYCPTKVLIRQDIPKSWPEMEMKVSCLLKVGFVLLLELKLIIFAETFWISLNFCYEENYITFVAH